MRFLRKPISDISLVCREEGHGWDTGAAQRREPEKRELARQGLTWERQVKALKRSKSTKQVKVMVVVRGVLALSSGIWNTSARGEKVQGRRGPCPQDPCVRADRSVPLSPAWMSTCTGQRRGPLPPPRPSRMQEPSCSSGVVWGTPEKNRAGSCPVPYPPSRTWASWGLNAWTITCLILYLAHQPCQHRGCLKLQAMER